MQTKTRLLLLTLSLAVFAVITTDSGVAVGMVLGMPLSAFIAEELSLSAAFWFGAATSALAFIGIAIFVPSMKITTPYKISEQIKVLGQSAVWISMLTTTLVFSAMFVGFSYIADYLINITGFSKNMTNALLVVFGVSGYIGNFIFSRCLQHNVIKTTVMYPLLFCFVYFAVWLWGGREVIMLPLIVVWGILHTAGLIVSQNWLMQDANSAPEFANSLYISCSNLGITIGALVGAWTIQFMDLHSIMWVGIVFAILAFVSIWAKIRLQSMHVAIANQDIPN